MTNETKVNNEIVNVVSINTASSSHSNAASVMASTEKLRRFYDVDLKR